MHLERPKSLSDLATEQIRMAIIQGEFELGASLSENVLSKRLGVSKTPIREALAALRLQGLVEFIPQKGAYVFRLSPDEVTQFCRYRYILEASAFDLTIGRDADPLIADLDRICAEMVKAQKDAAFEDYLKLDADFHDAFFWNCGNEFLHEGYRTVRDMVATMRTHLSKRPDRTAKSLLEHQNVLEFLKAGQATKAKSVLKKQITRGERAYADLSGESSLGPALKIVKD